MKSNPENYDYCLAAAGTFAGKGMTFIMYYTKWDKTRVADVLSQIKAN